MADTPFFTKTWAQHFQSPSYMVLMPNDAQTAFLAWQDFCKNPPCFLTDPRDYLGAAFQENQAIITAYRAFEQPYQILLSWLNASIRSVQDPGEQLAQVEINRHLQRLANLAKVITGYTWHKTKPKWHDKSPPKSIQLIRRWIRDMFLTCTKKVLHHARLNYRLHLSLLFQRQLIYLNQNPSYWRALIDKRVLQSFCFPKGQDGTDMTAVMSYRAQQYHDQHQQHLREASLPTAIVKTFAHTKTYVSVLDDYPSERQQARRELTHWQQHGQCPSNAYQIMSIQQLVDHANATFSMLMIAELMQKQAEYPPLLYRLKMKHLSVKPSQGSEKTKANTSINHESSMLDDIGQKQLLLCREALLILKTMLNRIKLCSDTQQFTSEDTFWHQHQKLTHAGLALFSATRIRSQALNGLSKDAVFVRESQHLSQIARMCHSILNFPELLPQVRQLKNQLLAMPLLSALPHLRAKPFTVKALCSIYYNTTLWTRIYQHNMALNQAQTLDLPTLHVIRQSLKALEEEHNSTMRNFGILTQWRQSVKKAHRYTLDILQQLNRQCLEQIQRNKSTHYRDQLDQFARTLVQDLLAGEHDLVEQKLAPFASTDITLVACEGSEDMGQSLVHLHAQDFSQELHRLLKERLEVLCQKSTNNTVNFHAFSRSLDAIEHSLACAWYDFAKTCKPMLRGYAARLVLLNACNPWHALTKEMVEQASNELQEDTQAKQHVRKHLAGTLAQALHDTARGYLRYNHDHNPSLLVFCGYHQGKTDYLCLLSSRNNGWLAQLSNPTLKLFTQDCPLPELSKALLSLQADTLTALWQIEQSMASFYLLEELLCTYIMEQICDEETYEDHDFSELGLDALQHLVKSFAKVPLHHLEECQDYVCHWIGCPGEHETGLIAMQSWLLGFSSDFPPLPPLFMMAFVGQFLCLSQLLRHIEYHSKTPPSLHVSAPLGGSDQTNVDVITISSTTS